MESNYEVSNENSPTFFNEGFCSFIEIDEYDPTIFKVYFGNAYGWRKCNGCGESEWYVTFEDGIENWYHDPEISFFFAPEEYDGKNGVR